MIKENKFLLLYLSLLVGIVGFAGLLSYKFIPLLIHDTVEYCQKIVANIAPSANALASSLLIIFLVLIGIGLVRLIALFVRTMAIRGTFEILNISRSSSLFKLIRKLNLQKQVVLIDRDKPVAFCYGIKNPHIYISSGLLSLLSLEELEVVLLHEKYHLLQKHNLTLFLSMALMHLLPFLPSIKDLHSFYKQNSELQADEYALIQTRGKKHLLKIFRKLISYESFVYESPVIATGLTDKNTIENRIKKLLDIQVETKHFQLRNSLISFGVISFLAVLLMTPVRALEVHANSTDVIQVCVGNVPCQQSCDGNFMTPLKLQSSINP